MKKCLKTNPAVFAVGKMYQIIVPVSCETVMWVRVGEECFYDDSNGILRSGKRIHKMSVPCHLLDEAEEYTICYRRIYKRKPYFSVTSDVMEESFSFRPVKSEQISVYHIADAHNSIKEPVACAKKFREEKGAIDLLILNGDVPEDSGKIENFETIYEIVSQITGGNIPTVFSRGNHDTRGIFAECIEDYTPCDNGKSYFTFRVGSLWGVVLDCGEDKPDTNEEYGNTVCCSSFRKRETAFLEDLCNSGETEFAAEGVAHRIVVAHNPFTRIYKAPFNIEEDTYSHWAQLLKERIKPEIMICGHIHEYSVDMPGCENDALGQPCPVVVASEVKNQKTDYGFAGFIFENNKIEIVFNNRNQVTGTFELNI